MQVIICLHVFFYFIFVDGGDGSDVDVLSSSVRETEIYFFLCAYNLLVKHLGCEWHLLSLAVEI